MKKSKKNKRDWKEQAASRYTKALRDLHDSMSFSNSSEIQKQRAFAIARATGPVITTTSVASDATVTMRIIGNDNRTLGGMDTGTIIIDDPGSELSWPAMIKMIESYPADTTEEQDIVDNVIDHVKDQIRQEREAVRMSIGDWFKVEV